MPEHIRGNTHSAGPAPSPGPASTTQEQITLDHVAMLGPAFTASELEWAGLNDPTVLEEALAQGVLALDDERFRFADPDTCTRLTKQLEADPLVALRVRLRIARAAYRRLEYLSATHHLRDALRLQSRCPMGETEDRGQLLLELARSQFRAGQMEEAWQSCESAADLGRARGDASLLADAATAIRGAGPGDWSFSARQHGLCREALQLLGDHDAVRQHRLRAQLVSTSNPWVESPPGPDPRGDAVHRGFDAESRYLDAAARHARLIHVEHVHERLALADETMALGLASGVDEYLAWGVLWRLDALYQLGRRVELQAELMTAVALADRMREPLWSLRILHVRTSLAMLRGDFEEAETLLAAAERLSSSGRLQGPDFLRLVFDSRLAILTGVGLPEVEKRVRLAIQPAPFFAHGWHAEVLLAMGRADEAATIWKALAPVTEDLPRETPEWLVAQAGHGDICVSLGDSSSAPGLYQLLAPYEDLFVIAGAETPPYVPVALVLGRLARLMGDQVAARRHVEAAARLSEAMHAVPAAEEARAELARLGRDTAPLSAREFQIAEMLAQGLTNRRIAERLHVSERTVENHVSHALGKLGVGSRSAVVAWFIRKV